MPVLNTETFPFREPVTSMARDPQTGREIDTHRFSPAFVQWFLGVSGKLDISAQRIASSRVQLQEASIAPTPLEVPQLGGGLYRVNYYARVTRPASTSSQLTVTINWTEGGVSCSTSGTVMNGNTVGAVQSATFPIRVDASSPVTVSTTYVSVGGTTMQYELDVMIEGLAVS